VDVLCVSLSLSLSLETAMRSELTAAQEAIFCGGRGSIFSLFEIRLEMQDPVEERGGRFTYANAGCHGGKRRRRTAMSSN